MPGEGPSNATVPSAYGLLIGYARVSADEQDLTAQQDVWIVSCLRRFPIPSSASSERLALRCLAGRMQLRPNLSHEALVLEALRDAVQAARVLQPKACCRLGESDARLLADECEEIVSPAARAGAI